LYLLTGLQRNTLYSRSNQRATPFSQQRDLLFLLISDNLLGQKTRGQIITGELVRYYAHKILLQGAPSPLRLSLQAAHITPFVLIQFEGGPELSQQNELSAGEKRKRQKDLIKM